MTSRRLSIALLAGNPAFSGILQRTLERDGEHRVASFESVDALTTYLRITPVDLLLLDAELPGAPAADIARGLRAHLRLASADFSIIALTRLPSALHAPLLAAGIDRVLSKPVTPHQLLLAVDALLPSRRVAAVSSGGVRPLAAIRNGIARSGNVIPLFGDGRGRR